MRISDWSSDVCSSDLKSTDKLASAYPIESCKAAIALIMDRDPKIIQGRKLADGQVHVSYRRPDDGKKWEARCEMVDDSHLQWAAFNAFGDGQMGRGRTEDRIEIKVSEGQVQVDVDQSGVMKKNERFSLISSWSERKSTRTKYHHQ